MKVHESWIVNTEIRLLFPILVLGSSTGVMRSTSPYIDIIFLVEEESDGIIGHKGAQLKRGVGSKMFEHSIVQNV